MRERVGIAEPPVQLGGLERQYTPDEQRRHDMLPEITGWVAVNGRNSIAFRERLKLGVP